MARPPEYTTRRTAVRRAMFGAATWTATLGGRTWAQQARPGSKTTATAAERLAAIERRGKEAGLGAFRTSTTEHFFGVGDARDEFRKSALDIAEALGKVFLAQLGDRGFDVAFPKERMAVVLLRDEKSYEAYLGQAKGADVGGHFDLDANQLVMFDFEPGGGERIANAERINTFALVHETTHQLSFNTGLLAIEAPPPTCISEGLATYFEMWQRSNRASAGSVNRPRLQAIREAAGDWIELPKLFTDPGLFERVQTEQLAYGQSWLMAYILLRTRNSAEGLRNYLASLKDPDRPADPIRAVEAHLGPLAKLEERLRREARSLLRA